jgi:hypothetical protein
MAGNDFEIKKKFAWKTGIFQQVTEVRATLVILQDRPRRVGSGRQSRLLGFPQGSS